MIDATGQMLLKLLFNENETICVSNSKFGYHSIPLEKVLSGSVPLLSPNEQSGLQHCKSSDLILAAINPIKGFRLDSNVYKFRTFLWEIDTGSIPQQIEYLKNCGVPLSAQVFSGNKSVHALTVLDEDLSSEAEYRELYAWALRIMVLCDQNCKNPSRSVRIPGAYREPGKKQRLMDMTDRISIASFKTWLNLHESCRPKPRQKRLPIDGEEDDYNRLSIWARINLKKGIDFKLGRNKTWYSLAYDFALSGYSEDKTIDILSKYFTEERDFKEKEWLITIGSAFKHVEENKD